MRIAIVSDIHANLQAWNAALLDIRSSGVDHILCLGDIVGYGPNPAEVLESVHANVDYLVLGNHDAAACGKIDTRLFNASAQQIIQWTRGRLTRSALRFLETLPLCLEGEFFRCTHGDFSAPGMYQYIAVAEDARASWGAVAEPLLFVGHTHQPALFLLGSSGIPRSVEPQDFALEEGKRFLVNVGSVGQPRDGQVRTSYCVLDTEERAVYFRKIPFDIDAYRAALRQANVPEAASYFLQHDPRAGVPPLREMTSFSPPATAEQGVTDAVTVRKVERLERSVRAWRRRFVVGLGAALVAATVAGGVWWRQTHRSLDLVDPALPTLLAAEAAAGTDLLPPPAAAPGKAVGLAGWNVHLGDRRRQSVRVDAAPDGEAELVLQSGAPRDEVRVTSALVVVTPGRSIGCAALFKKEVGFAGEVGIRVSLVRSKAGQAETVSSFMSTSPNVSRQNGWMEAKASKRISAGGTRVQLHVEGRFQGVVRVRGTSLEWR